MVKLKSCWCDGEVWADVSHVDVAWDDTAGGTCLVFSGGYMLRVRDKLAEVMEVVRKSKVPGVGR